MPQKVGDVDERYGRLRPIEYIRGKGWRCVCDCGNEKTVLGGNLRRGNVVSCGCFRSERCAETGLATINRMREANKVWGWALYNEVRYGRRTGDSPVRPMLLKCKKKVGNCWVCRRPTKNMLCLRCHGYDSNATKTKVGKRSVPRGKGQGKKQKTVAA